MTTSVVESQPAVPQGLDVSPVEPADSAWTPLYRVGGVAALLAVAIMPLAVFVFLAWPPPTTIESWFALFQRNGFLGLLDLDLLLVTSYVVMIPLYLALYIALRRVSQSFMAIALAFNLLGTALILAANPAAAMLTLSDRYAAATTDAQRAVFLGAGQALLVNWSGTAFDLGYLFGGIGILIIAIVMLRSTIFGKFTAYTGLVMGAVMLVPASAGTVGLVLSLVSLVPTAIWLLLVARRLFQLAARPQEYGTQPQHISAGTSSGTR
jgi:hypothetical protein